MKKDIVKSRKFVIPGQKIVESIEYLPGKNCYREGNAIYSKRVGIVYVKDHVINVVPLSGIYIPERGDMVIGEIIDIQPSGWVVNINSSYSAFLPLGGIRQFVDPIKTDMASIYNIGEFIYTKVSIINTLKVAYLTMREQGTKKLVGGRIVKISPVKIPRVIGKNASMISMIKEKTECKIIVGKNGIIWIDGKNVSSVINVLKLIEEKSHISGLTEIVSKILEKEVKK